MSLSLTVEDLRLLNEAQSSLLSPQVWEDPQSWANQVVRRVARLLGADSGAFQVLRPRERPLAALLNIEESTVQEYMDYYVERELLPASPTPAVHYLPDTVSRERLEASEIYNDFWKPTGQFDNLAVVAPMSDGWQAGMFFHQSRESRRRFGERGKVLLRMLLPVMVSGARTYGRWSRRNEKFLRFLDRVEDGLLLCDVSGGVRHANPALVRMLADDPESGDVRGQAEALAGRLAAAVRGPALLERSPDAPAPVRVVTEQGVYRIRGSYLDEAALGGPGILITVQTTRAGLPDVAALRERFGLTRRQAEVALLLAQRKTNDEIAERLFISPHTVRRHTENVFLKLGVSSRLDVRSTIAG